MWRHYVYLHRRADNGEPFYVGKGKLRRSGRCYERAHAPRPKNSHWTNIVARHGLDVEIVAHCPNDEAARAVEIAIIAEIGRRDLGKGPLINLTDGGDGHAGLVVSVATRRKRSVNAQGPRSESWRQAIRRARAGGGNGGVVKKGDRLPPAWVASIAKGKVGAKNPNFGKPTPISKKVFNASTGALYPSIAAAARGEGLTTAQLYQYLDGTVRNPTALVKADG